ncbi:MAG: PorP/SprF family type IX secretion system membrane protein [Bacteroidales bacterium]|nr:PorP/SprF family type IX secretion system membrane protein [Bacteroidales bacterium]
MKNKIFILAIFICFGGKTFAQLAVPLAMYTGNQILYNPGYTGLYDLLSINLTTHKSWVGMRGSPTIINFNGHAPFESQRNALGFVYQREEWGNLTGNSAYTNYSHKVYLSKGILNLGVQAGFLNHIVDWDKIEYVMHENDPTLEKGRTQNTKFDAGFGAYYLAMNWYAGISAMNLMQPRYGIHQINGREWYSQMRSQFYLMGGYVHRMGEWSVRPEIFMRYVHTVPFLVNVGLHVFYENTYGMGVMLRTGSRTVNFNLKANVAEGFRIGYSYGVSYGALKPYQRGSHEIQINYTFQLWKREEVNYQPNWWQ